MARDKINPYMPSSSDYSSVGAAAQTHDLVASGGILNGAIEFVTESVPTFAAATVVNVLNIPHDLAEIPYKLATGNTLDSGKVELDEVLGKLDTTLNTNLEDYYSKHKEGIDASAYIASSIIPGTLGVKALRLGMSTTKAAVAAESGLVGRSIGTFEGLGAKSLAAAKKEVLDGSPFTYLNRNALNLAAAGATVGVVETLAFNTAATLALHNSPYFDNKDAWDLAKDSVTDSLLFGGATGALFGSVLNNTGKVGLLGFRQTVKPYKAAVDGLTREAADIGGVGQAIEELTPFTTTKGKKNIPVQTKIFDGDLAMAIKDNLDGLKTSTKLQADIIDLETKGLLSTDPAFRLQEIAKFKSDRETALSLQSRLFESKVNGLFKEVSDIVETKDLVKNLLDGDVRNAAALLSGLKRMSPLTEDAIRNLDKVKNISRTVVMDLKTNTIVSSPAGNSIFDLTSKEQASKVLSSITTSFTEEALASGSLTGMSGSVMYKRALNEVGDNLGTLVKRNAGNNFNLDKDLALVDVLANKASTLNPELKIRVNGIEKTVDETLKLVAEKKIDLIAEAAASGKSVEELSAMLHMPDAKVMKPDLTGMTNDLASSAGQSPRYILAEYDTLVRSLKPNKFVAEGNMDFKARVKLIADERNQSLTQLSPEIMSFGSLPVKDFNGTGAAGVFTHGDSGIGNHFQQSFQVLTKLYHKVMNDAASARVGAIDSLADQVLAGGKTSAAYTELAGITTWMETAAAKGNGVNLWHAPNGNSYIVQRNLVNEAVDAMKAEAQLAKKAADSGEAFQSSGAKNVSEMLDAMIGKDIKAGISRDHTVVQVRTPEVKNYFLGHASADAESLAKSNELRRLQAGAPINPGYTEPSILSLKMPSPNKAKHPFALVVKGPDAHQNPAYAGQSKVFVFKSIDELKAAKATANQEGLEAYTAKETKDFFKAVEKYDNSLSFNGSSLKAELTSKHKMFVGSPESRSVEQFLADNREWHMRSELAVQRNIIALKHSDEFVSLKAISANEANARDSGIVSGNSIRQFLDKGKPTPAEEVMNQLLAIKNPGTVNGIIKFADDAGNKFLSPVFDAFSSAKSLLSNKNKPVDLEELTKTYEKLGIEKSYQEAMYKAVNKTVGEDSAFDKSVRASNMVLVTGQLRLDGLNSIVNIIGSPILGGSTVGLMIRDTAKGLTPEAKAVFNRALGVDEGGFLGNTVNFLKLSHKSIGRDTMLAKDSLLGSFANSANETLPQLYNRLGITQSGLEAIRQDSQTAMIDLLRSGEITNKAKMEGIFSKVINGASKPSDFVEAKLQFLAADAGLQIAEAAKAAGNIMSSQDILALMNTITQKLHGNYTASQRPQLFQGSVGAAIGLFQAYQARLVHRVLDVVDSGDKRMLAEMAALQAGIFGAKSLPGFNQINTYLVAENNKDKQDIYTTVFGSTDRAVAEGLLYGVGSSVLGLNLSTRGAVDFRAPSNLTEVPSVAIWKGLINNVSQFVSQASNGADISASLSHAVQHNVFNRPIQQLASVMSGYSTTMSGKEAVNINDNKFQHPQDWMPHWATQTMRMLGGKPLDEAVYLDTVFRFNNYRLEDRAKTLEIGQALMSHAREGNEITPEQKKEFTQKYVSNGGTLTGFNNWYKNQLSSASTDSGDRLRKMVKNSEEARQLSIMLGGKQKYIPQEELDIESNVK